MKQTLRFTHPPRRLCILRLSAIGDVCHMVSVVQRIQQHWPETMISWVIGKTEVTLLEGLPGIEFIVFDKKSGLKGYYQLYRELRQRSFDVLLHMQTALRASLVSLVIPAKKRIGFDRIRAKDFQWLFTQHKIEHQPQQHVLESFHGFADSLGIPKVPLSWNIPISNELESWAKQIITPGTKALIITPASSADSRNWTTAGYTAIARYAVERYKMKVILCGGKTAIEQQLGDEIKKNCPFPINDLIGKTSLKQLLALIKQATVLLAPDTGPAHMATMVSTPVISLFANTNPDRARPYLSQDYVVSHYPQAMQKHYKKTLEQLPWGTRARDPKLMELITVDEVIRQFDRLMQQ